MKCDVTDAGRVDGAFAEVEAAHGPVEVLVANAGITADTLVLRMSDDDWSRRHRHQPDRLVPGRQARREGHAPAAPRTHRLDLLGGRAARLAGQVNYAASKAGLVGMARSLARELGSRSITANVVRPGFVETEMTAVLPEEKKAEYKAQIPLGRYASVEEVAAGVHWLASDGAAYVTGAVIPVDGGLGMGH